MKKSRDKVLLYRNTYHSTMTCCPKLHHDPEREDLFCYRTSYRLTVGNAALLSLDSVGSDQLSFAMHPVITAKNFS